MSDIALRAGVSRATVSFVLNEKHRAVGISEETRRRVVRAAQELGYRRNEAARQMVTGRSRVLGFLTRDVESEVTGRILAGILEEAENSGYFVKVLAVGDGRDAAQAVARATELRLAGVMALYMSDPFLTVLQDEMQRCGDTPVVVLDSSFPQPRGVRVLSDDRAGCREAIAHLTALGHRRITFVAGTARSGASVEREEGFRAAMTTQGLTLAPDAILYGNWMPDQIAAEVERVFSADLPVRPTALLCADDRTALTAIRTLRRKGLLVPEDVSIVGFADMHLAPWADPPLTTVSQPFREMGRVAVRQLIAMAADNFAAAEKPLALPSPRSDVLLSTHLVVRESTAPPPPPIQDKVVRVALVSDTHETRDPNKAAYRQHFDKVIASVNDAGVDFVLIAGDLTDEGLPEQYDDFRAQMTRFHSLVRCIPGNHDIGDKRLESKPGAGVDQPRIDLYARKLGPTFWAETLAPGVRVIGVNTPLLGSGLFQEEEQWRLLERELEKNGEAQRGQMPLIVLQHYPLFDAAPDEPGGGYWNIEPTPRKRYLELLEAATVRVVLSGHLHRPLNHRVKDLRFVGTPPVAFGLPSGKQPEGWTLITLLPDGSVEARFFPLTPD